MEGSSEIDLTPVYHQINNFPSSETDHFTENIQHSIQPKIPEVESTDKRLSELTQLEADVKRLEAAIKRKEYDRNSSRAQNIETSLKTNELADAENKRKSIDVIYAETESLKHKLEITEYITGITLTHSECKITEKGENFLKYLRVIKGECGEIQFQLELEVLEILKSDTSSTAEIVEMKVNVEQHFYYSLKDAVDRLSAEKSAQGFLRLLEPYQRWCSVRDKTFSHFQEKYPDIVKVHMDMPYQCLIISNLSKNWHFSVNWGFQVKNQYMVEPDINLGIKVPETVLESNQKNVLTSFPATFDLMLHEYGIERAINSVIHLAQL
ncbi:hypothetical protein CHS0354_032968 [Potamilus streckersoni]|uniref:Centromere protein P n=1 Tax=Potamilus streckersoni TaxID=2493646 RepID=A0AAE0RX33_9BIVA|nr:hypothetical protein CHS0354_032968 [Potamilus streckersoni]